jgi:ribosomal protein L33
MKFHAQYCGICKNKTLFLEKLVDPSDVYCTEMEDKCQICNTQFYIKEKQMLKIKLIIP